MASHKALPASPSNAPSLRVLEIPASSCIVCSSWWQPWSKVFFISYDPLTSGDTDSGRKDVYERSGGTVTLLSTGGNGPYGADFDGATPDGTHVYFHTDESLAPVNAIIQSVEQGVPWRGEGAQKFLEELSTLLVPNFGSVLGEVVGFQANLQQAAQIMHEADSGAQKIVAGLESTFESIFN